MDLIAFFQTPQDADRVFDRRLSHIDLLETTLQGRVLFDVLAKLIQRGGPHAAQLPARQHRL